MSTKHPLALRGAQTEEHEDFDENSWTSTTRTVLEGVLAARVRRRFEVPPSLDVWIAEERSEGGTEYTRETHTRFIVGYTGTFTARSVAFLPTNTNYGWDPTRVYGETIYDRFGTWLDAAHRGNRCWDEWVDESSREHAGNFARIDLRLDAGLGRATIEHSNERALDSAYLWGERRDGAWQWRLDGVKHERHHFHRPEHDDVFKPLDFHTDLGLQTKSCAETMTDRRRILMAATDLVCPGRPQF